MHRFVKIKNTLKEIMNQKRNPKRNWKIPRGNEKEKFVLY